MTKWTYLGTLDDTVYRYPFTINGSIAAESPLRTLLRAALFGDPVIVHEGYLVHNPGLRKLIQSPDRTMLHTLARSGRLVVLSAKNDIAASQADKAKAGVNTSADPAFLEEWPSIKPYYDQLSQTLNDVPSPIPGKAENAFLRVPRRGSTNAAALRLGIYKRALEVSHPYQLGLSVSQTFFERFAETFIREARSKTPRSAWEDALRTHLSASDPYEFATMQDFMTFASEAYHLTMASSLSRAYELAVPVETNYSLRFRGIFEFIRNPATQRQNYNIRVPFKPLLERFDDFCSAAFADTGSAVHNARIAYDSDRSITEYAAAYERAIYDFLGLSQTLKQLDEQIEENVVRWWNRTSIAGVGFGAVIAGRRARIDRNKIDRRQFMKRAGTVAAAYAMAKAALLTEAPSMVAGALKSSGVFTIQDYGTPTVGGEEEVRVLESFPIKSGLLARLSDDAPIMCVTNMEVTANDDALREIIANSDAQSL